MTINMTGKQADASTETNTIDASDLLNDDGTVNVSMVRSRTNHRHGDANVDDATCADIRRRLADLETCAAVADAMDIGDSTIRKHAKGECMCVNDATPFEYHTDRGWVRVDESMPTLDDFGDEEVTE